MTTMVVAQGLAGEEERPMAAMVEAMKEAAQREAVEMLPIGELML